MALVTDIVAANHGIAYTPGERVLHRCDEIHFEITLPESKRRLTRDGAAAVTSLQLTFVPTQGTAELVSFAMPFYCMHGIELKQPWFGANALVGKVDLMHGPERGTASFSLQFPAGGAIPFSQALERAVRQAQTQYARGSQGRQQARQAAQQEQDAQFARAGFADGPPPPPYVVAENPSGDADLAVTAAAPAAPLSAEPPSYVETMAGAMGAPR